MLKGEKLKYFPLRSGMEVLARAIRQEREIKGIQIGKEEVKLLLYSYDIICLCVCIYIYVYIYIYI